MIEQINEYMVFYCRYAHAWWNGLGPKGYVTLLSLVGGIGYFTMLKGPKRL